MKLVSSLVLAAGVAVAGIAFAAAAENNTHTMTVQLANGGVAHITYAGNTPPKVQIDNRFATPAAFARDPAFAMFAQMQTDMNRRMQLMQAMFHDPALWQRPEVDTAGKGSAYCMQSVQITQNGNAKPTVVRHSAGDCGNGSAQHSAPSHATLQADPSVQRPDMTTISYR
jgi:hypothetical protein